MTLRLAQNVNLMSLGAVASDLRSQTNASDIVGLMAWLLAFVFVTFLSIDHDRFRSWDRAADGTLKETKRTWMGVVVPNLISILMFAAYQAKS